jgi:hypothetical protein
MPDILAQNDFLRFADLEPGFNLDGLVVTAIESLEPGFSLRYDSIPLRFKPPESLLPSFRVHAGDYAMTSFSLFIVRNFFFLMNRG